MSPPCLCTTFKELSDQTAERISAAAQIGLQWSEETNTETLLLDIQRRHPQQVRVAAFNKVREAQVGSDWEWWIEDARGWVGLRVQAKRIKLPKEEFWRLQRYRSSAVHQFQIDVLIAASHRDNLNPVYCFYVGATAGPNGCFVAHAQTIKAAATDKWRGLAGSALPWDVLVCPPPPSNSNVSAAAQSYQRLKRLAISGDHSGGSRIELHRARELPDYARRLLDSADHKQEIGERAHAKRRRLAGVVIIAAND